MFANRPKLSQSIYPLPDADDDASTALATVNFSGQIIGYTTGSGGFVDSPPVSWRLPGGASAVGMGFSGTYLYDSALTGDHPNPFPPPVFVSGQVGAVPFSSSTTDISVVIWKDDGGKDAFQIGFGVCSAGLLFRFGNSGSSGMFLELTGGDASIFADVSARAIVPHLQDFSTAQVKWRRTGYGIEDMVGRLTSLQPSSQAIDWPEPAASLKEMKR